MPPGFRAVWPKRDELATAKLGSWLRPGMKEEDFASVLLPPGTGTIDDDFVEVHIYDRIHRSAVDYVLVKRGSTGKGRGSLLLLLEMEMLLGKDRVKEV